MSEQRFQHDPDRDRQPGDLANEIRTLREQNQSLRVALAEIELILRGAGAGK